MDGLLVDSEPLWQDAEMTVFGEVGLHLSREQCKETMGWRLDEVVAFRYRQFPWEHISQEEVEERIVEEVIRLVKQKAMPLPGVAYALDFFAQKNIPLGLASSSASRIIATVLEKFGINDRFEVVRSAEKEAFGKPHPGIFLETAKALKANPVYSIVLEDSLNGVIAAKAARMTCIAVPEAANYDNPKFNIADLLLSSLEELNEEHFHRLEDGLRLRP